MAPFVILSVDNGGDEAEGSDNSPLRSEKGTYFSGGIRGAAFVTSPLLTQTGVEYTGLLHLSDWMATLVNLAGGDVTDLDLDGFDVWEAIRLIFKRPLFSYIRINRALNQE